MNIEEAAKILKPVIEESWKIIKNTTLKYEPNISNNLAIGEALQAVDKYGYGIKEASVDAKKVCEAFNTGDYFERRNLMVEAGLKLV